MRFRLGTTGVGDGQGMFDGVSRGFAAFGSLPLAQAQAAEQYQDAEMKRQLAGAQTRQADAHSALFGQQAEAERTQLARGTAPEMIRTAAMMNRLPPEQMDEFSRYAQNGKLDPMYQQPGDGVGPVAPKPAYADQNGVGGEIMRTLGLLRGGLAAGDKNIDNVAQAQGRFQQQDAVRDVTANPQNAGRVGQAFAAAHGQKLIDNIGDSGAGFNQFTGEGATLNPAMVALFGQKGAAEVGQKNASAASSYASAAHSNALTDKTRQDINEGRRTAGLSVVTGPNGEVTVVDKFNRTAEPVLGADGRPVVKGTAGGGGKPMTEGQAKANIYGGRMTESGKILSDLEDKGVLRPGNIKGLAEGTGRMLGLGTESMGGALADAAGAATNWTQSPDQQSVDQARRDFINAVLRRESGATIQPAEFANAEKQYFPQPGDSKQVRDQKRRNRQIATTLMLQEVPEAQRYKPAGAPPVAPPQGGATGSWGPPAGQRNVPVTY